MTLKDKLLSQKETTSSLHNKFKGETCIIAGCSPYLLDHGRSKVEKLLGQYYSIAIKQSYDLFPSLFNAHIYNCCNFKHYNYPKNKPLVIESSTLPPSENDFDLYFNIQERRESHTISSIIESRCDEEIINHWSLDKRPTYIGLIDKEEVPVHIGPYGPGILSEIVFYLSVFLGFSRVISIGCDLSHKNGSIHFYRDKSGSPKCNKMVEKNDPHKNLNPWIELDKEKEMFINSLTYWQKWFIMNNSKFETISNCSPMPNCIPRVNIDELI